MPSKSKKQSFSTFFSEGQYATQLEKIDVKKDNQKLTIGIPKEVIIEEKRISLVPHSIRSITGYGHNVIIESGAGEGAHYSDSDYASAGAEITKDTKRVFESQMIIKSAPITSKEVDFLKRDQILINPLQLPLMSKEILKKLQTKKVTSIATGFIRNEGGGFPILRMMSKMAGKLAVITASELLCNDKGGRGVLMGGAPGVPPAKVVILGAGVAGESAAKVAVDMGASVRIFDNDFEKIARLQENLGRTFHTSSINPEYLAYQLTSADVLIGAVHSKLGRSPIIVTNEMVEKMKLKSVIIDLTIDQGGCIESSRLTTHERPTFVYEGVTHYCIPNVTSKVARTASQALSNILVAIILNIGEESQDIGRLLYQKKGLRGAVYTFNGYATNAFLAKRFDQKFTSLDLILTSEQ
ncbi:MAG: alanine dehydrogenase [Saprospiraceae bacterium]